MEDAIPQSGFLIEREDAVALGRGTTAVAFSDEEGEVECEQLLEPAYLRIRRALAALRLATGTTAHAIAHIRGQPGLVRSISPDVHSLPYRGGLWLRYRTAALTPELAVPLGSLAALLAQQHPEPGSTAFVAIGRLTRMLDEPAREPPDQMLDIATGLEAALSGSSDSEIALRLRNRAAALLSTEDDPPEAIYDDVKIVAA